MTKTSKYLIFSALLLVMVGLGFSLIQNSDFFSQNEKLKQGIEEQLRLSTQLSEEINQQRKPLSNQPKLIDVAEVQSEPTPISSNQTETAAQKILPPFASLNIKLLSIAEIGKNKLATLSYNNSVETYRSQQSLDENLKIAEIKTDTILLAYANDIFELKVSTDSIEQMMSSTASVLTPEAETKKQILQFQQMLKRDPYALIGVIGIKQYQRAGINGFELRPRIDKKLFRELGLKEGDVIVSINEMPVANGLNVEQLYQALTTKNKFVIKVIREGSQLEYILNLSS